MPGSTAQQHNNVITHYFLKQVACSFTMQSCPENVTMLINQSMSDKKNQHQKEQV